VEASKKLLNLHIVAGTSKEPIQIKEWVSSEE